MDQPGNVQLPLSRLSKIREVLDLVAAIRAVDAELTTADGLRQTIALVLRFADLVGVDEQWSRRAHDILLDPGIFNIVLAIVQYVSGLAGHEQDDSAIRFTALAAGDDVVVDAQSLMEWLPLVIQIISLVRQVRRG